MKDYYSIILFLVFIFNISYGQQESQVEKIIRDSDTIEQTYERVRYINGMAGRMRYATETIDLLNHSKQIAVNDINSQADTYYSLGNYHYFNNAIDSSIFYLNKTIELEGLFKDPFIKASALSTRGGAYNKLGNVPLTISSYLEAQVLFDAIDTTQLEGRNIIRHKGKLMELHNAIANFYNNNGEQEKAITYYEKAIEKALGLKAGINAGIIIGNKGDVLLKLGRNEEALDNFLKGMRLKKEGNAPNRLIANSHLHLGNAYTALDKYDKALIHFKESLEVFTTNKLDDKTAEALSGLGKLQLNNNLFKDAIVNCEEAKSKAQASQYKKMIVQSCDCLHKAYKETGKFNLALENFEIYQETQNSIFNENNVKKQTQLEMQYEFDKTQAIKDLEIESKEKQSKLYSIIAVVLGLFALLLGYFFYKRSKTNKVLSSQKTLLEKTIDQKNVLLKETHHRVKNSFQMVSSLLYIQGETTEQVDAQIAIKEAQNRVRSMVLTHQKLYNTEDLVGIDTKEYITDLTKDVVDSYNLQNNVDYNIEAEKHILNIDTITPLGIILNELVTNCFKHAFNETIEQPLIFVGFKKEDENYILEISDNGIGISSDRRDGALGLELLDSLAQKLNGTFTIAPHEKGGTHAIIKFELYKLE
ncbi:MAG: tetratricopeptide repeat-containing sensor histidine kinase [Nonlabens sp.]|uniref:tetratricopeptide repeat-containing sensor histidine kinase n=1 Tax=Nonlabens sp. TaxID=1888209 RepID=UPI003EF7A959